MSECISRLSGMLILTLAVGPVAGPAAEVHRSPYDLEFSPSGDLLVVSDRTAGLLVIIEPTSGRLVREVRLAGRPAGIAWADAASAVYVAEYGAGTVAEIDTNSGRIRRRLEVGVRPVGLALAPRRRLLVVANTTSDDVSILDLESGRQRARVSLPREPHFVAVTPDSSLAVVGNLLPRGSAADPKLASCVSLIDLGTCERMVDVALPPGSTAVRELAVSADARWAYVAHTVGRFGVPTIELERGWVNTNALSIIDLEARTHYATLLLDQPTLGAADPWGMVLEGDNSALWISLRGTHTLARVDLVRLHHLLAGAAAHGIAPLDSPGGRAWTSWRQIRANPALRKRLVHDLKALHAARLVETVPLEGYGPTGLALSPDGRILATALYYSGQVILTDTETREVVSTILLGSSSPVDAIRRGEMLFHDATICFQRWMSCASCHPDDARTDGLRWDLLNDGMGTPQRTRSLLYSHRTGPTTSRGVRSGLEESVKKGLQFLQYDGYAELAGPLVAYIKSLEPEPSPYLVRGQPTPEARRGKELFEGKAKCERCHRGATGTDLKAHDVGTRGPFDGEEDIFYTPKLLELYRTAPFLHDGRAATLREIFTRHDGEKRHGKASELSDDELGDLIAYLKSL